MSEEQTIAEFHMQIRDIANASFALGEKMSEEKLVRKILRSLPKRFALKVTTIEEAQYISAMQVDELIGSLQTFEMTLNDKPDKKSKSIAFVSNNAEVDDQSEVELAGEFTDALALLGRKFNKAFKRFDRKSRPNVLDKESDNFKRSENFRNSGYQRKAEEEERPS
jgi:hypothetical protein